MFQLIKEPVSKTMVARVWGFMTEENAKKFMTEYKEMVATLKPSDYRLIVDATELLASKMELLEDLQACFRFYMEDGFEKILMVYPTQATCKMQLNRVSRMTNFTGTFVNTIDEARRF